jgi:CheY-like chemotaxis protein
MSDTLNHNATDSPAHLGKKIAPRILLVDDDEGFRYVYGKVIAGAGFRVELARDHHKALEILEDGEKLALMVTDLVMPGGINGFALARMARLRRPGLKVLYLTGRDDAPSHEAVGKILRKPVEDELLLAEIRALAVADAAASLSDT